MGKIWEFVKKYILTFDTIIVLIIIALVVYFIITAKKKKYKFHGVSRDEKGEWVTDAPGSTFPIRKKRKKRVNAHEEECRKIFQTLYGVKFKSVRPDFLKNPATGKNLELDGYAPGISTPLGVGLAFEYDGEQHSKYNSHFHNGNVDAFKYQMAKDDYKSAICKKQGIMLIRIPYYIAFHDLERYIRSELKRKNINIPGYGGLFSQSRYENVNNYSHDFTGNMYG